MTGLKLFVCVGNERSAVQPVCCGSGREKEPAGQWTLEHKGQSKHNPLSRCLLSVWCLCPGSSDFNRPGQVHRAGGSPGFCKLQIYPGAAGAAAGRRVERRSGSGRAEEHSRFWWLVDRKLWVEVGIWGNSQHFCQLRIYLKSENKSVMLVNQTGIESKVTWRLIGRI